MHSRMYHTPNMFRKVCRPKRFSMTNVSGWGNPFTESRLGGKIPEEVMACPDPVSCKQVPVIASHYQFQHQQSTYVKLYDTTFCYRWHV